MKKRPNYFNAVKQFHTRSKLAALALKRPNGNPENYPLINVFIRLKIKGKFELFPILGKSCLFESQFTDLLNAFDMSLSFKVSLNGLQMKTYFQC